MDDEQLTNAELAQRLREYIAAPTQGEYDLCGFCLMDHAEQVEAALSTAADAERLTWVRNEIKGLCNA